MTMNFMDLAKNRASITVSGDWSSVPTFTWVQDGYTQITEDEATSSIVEHLHICITVHIRISHFLNSDLIWVDV